MTARRLNRRSFLHHSSHTASALLAVPYLIPATALGRDGAVAPSEKVTVGFIGTGSHGVGRNLKMYLKQPDAQVLAVCDVDGSRIPGAKKLVDDQYGNTDCATTRDFRDILQRDDIDAVMISTPDHWHVLMSVMAIRAGKDVQCEKPTLTIDEGKILVETVRRHKKVFQTSTEDRSLKVYHRMAEQVRNGRIGKLQRIEVILPKQPPRAGDPTVKPIPPDFDWDMWLGPAPEAPYTPDGVHFNFRWIWAYSGGIICDWGTHLFDTAQWANNTERSGPIEIDGKGTFWEGGLFDTVKDYDVTYKYANGVVMTCKPGNPSIKFIGTDGFIGNQGWNSQRILTSSDDVLEPAEGPEAVKLFTEPAGEHRNFLDCVKSRNDPYFPVDIGHRISTICHLANISIKLGRKIQWDPDKEQFPSDKDAAAMMSRKMRSPWSLE